MRLEGDGVCHLLVDSVRLIHPTTGNVLLLLPYCPPDQGAAFPGVISARLLMGPKWLVSNLKSLL
jgi:hypothetical protein